MIDRALRDAFIVVPVRNGGHRWVEAAAALRQAVPDPSMVAVVDSSSTDGSERVARDNLFRVHRISVESFNHGRTRQEAVDRFAAGRRFVVFLTQDAVLEGRPSLISLLGSFSDDSVGAAYGRQRPHRDARPFGAHATVFNYPATSDTRTLADAARLGIRTAFFSNSFAAYRMSALRVCGGFPHHLILGEDACLAMRMLVEGWRVRYCAEACVRHSHDYTILQDLQRYFDIGVMHAQIPELIDRFGAAEGEGVRFLVSEFRYIRSVAPLLLPQVLLRNAAKYVGYRLGRGFRTLPHSLRRGLSMTKGFWAGHGA